MVTCSYKKKLVSLLVNKKTVLKLDFLKTTKIERKKRARKKEMESE